MSGYVIVVASRIQFFPLFCFLNPAAQFLFFSFITHLNFTSWSAWIGSQIVHESNVIIHAFVKNWVRLHKFTCVVWSPHMVWCMLTICSCSLCQVVTYRIGYCSVLIAAHSGPFQMFGMTCLYHLKIQVGSVLKFRFHWGLSVYHGVGILIWCTVLGWRFVQTSYFDVPHLSITRNMQVEASKQPRNGSHLWFAHDVYKKLCCFFFNLFFADPVLHTQ